MNYPPGGVARSAASCLLCAVLAGCGTTQQSDLGASTSPYRGDGLPDFTVLGLPSGWRVQEALDSGVRVHGNWVTRRKTIVPPYEDPDGAHVPYSVCAATLDAFESGCSTSAAVLDQVVKPELRYAKPIRIVVSRGNGGDASHGPSDDQLMGTLQFDF